MNPINWLRKKIKQLYAWTAHWAQTKNAERALFGLSFAESSFFPIPPDPLLMAMVFSKTERWVRYATLTTIASILGGIFGYFIGFLLFDAVGEWLITTYHLQAGFDSLATAYQDNSVIAVFGAAFTPIPYKIITLSAGVFRVNFFAFLMASVLGRSARFFAVSFLAKYLGKNHKEKIEKYIDLISLGLLAAIILIVFILSR